MEIVILPNPDAVTELAAQIFAHQVRTRPESVLGLATGGTPVGVYKRLVAEHQSGRLDFSRITTFNLDEYAGLAEWHECSYRRFMREHLFDHVNLDPRYTHVPNGMAPDIVAECAAYEKAIRDAGGIDLQLLGLGSNGHIGFNEPGSSLASRTRTKTLTEETRSANQRFFTPPDSPPHHVITMGIGTILDTRRVVILATGAHKAAAVAGTAEGPITAMLPGSALQFHPRCTLICDEPAAGQLRMADYYRFVWDNRPPFQRLG